MEDFTKVRSGIAGLKKEREDLKKNYAFLTKELERIVEANEDAIKKLSGKSESLATSMAAMEERLGKTDGSISSAKTSLSSTLSAVQKRLDSQKKTIESISNKVQKVTDTADAAVSGVSENRRFGDDAAKTLQNISSKVAGLDEKLEAFEKSVSQNLSSVDNKLTSGITLVNRATDEQSSVIKDHDSALQRLTLSLQSLKKDLEKENERVSRIKESSSKNSTRLEMLGTLQSKIKHIEDVKAGLVKGVESIKSMRNDMAALEQRTKDLGLKLSDADKFLESRLVEKAKVLDSQIEDKTTVMENQMQERLAFLESNLSERAKTMETKISGNLSSMGKILAREGTDLKKAKSGLQDVNSELRKVNASSAALKTGLDDSKKSLKTLSQRVDSLDSLGGRVKEIEEAKSVVLDGISALDGLEKKVDLLSQRERSFESNASSDISALRGGMKKSADDISKIRLSIAGLKKDADNAAKAVSAVKTDQTETKKKLSEIATLRQRIAAAEKLEKTLSANMAEIRRLHGHIETLSKNMESNKIRMEDVDAAIDKKIDYNISALKKDVEAASKNITGINANQKSFSKKLSEINALGQRVAAVEKLENKLSGNMVEIRKLHDHIQKLGSEMESSRVKMEDVDAAIDKKIDYNASSFKKDVDGAMKQISGINVSQKSFSKKLQEINAIRQRVAAVEKLEKTLSGNMAETRKLHDNIQALGKDMESGRIKMEDVDASIDKKIDYNTSTLKKDVASAVKMITGIKADHATTKKKLSEIATIRQRLASVEKLEKVLSGNMAEIRKLHDHIQTLGKDMESGRIKMEDVNAAIDAKVDYNVSALKKDNAFNSAALSKLEDGVKKFSIDLNSLKKDVGSGTRNMSIVKSSVESLQKKSADLEKLQIKLGDMGNAKAALTDAMEAKLNERIKFLEKTLGQKADSIESRLSEKSRQVESRIGKDVSGIKKELSEKSKSIESVNKRMEKMGILEERLKAVDQAKDMITKDVSSLRDMKASMSKADERSRGLDRELRALKAQVESGLIEVRGRLDSKTTTGENKFNTAVKAFLNARADLNKKISMLNVKMTDSDRRIEDFSKLVSRIDMLERKVDRLSERGAEIRRDIDDLERKEDTDQQQKVMVVDLEKGREF